MRGEEVRADEAEDGAEVDDRTAAAATKGRDRVLRAEEDALQVRIQHGVPRFLRADVDGAVSERTAADAGAVEDDVQPPEPLLRGGHSALGVVRTGEVADEVDVIALDAVDAEDTRSRIGEGARATAPPIPPAAPVTSAALPSSTAPIAVESHTVSAAIEAIRSQRVVAILRRVADPAGVVRALREGGIGVVEITLDSPDALETIASFRDDPELVVLAGTVRTADDVRAAVAAGAQACVGPGLVPEVLAACREAGLPGSRAR